MSSNNDIHSNLDGVLVEVLTASGCGRCQQARSLAREVITGLTDGRIRYRGWQGQVRAASSPHSQARQVPRDASGIFSFLPAVIKPRNRTVVSRLY